MNKKQLDAIFGAFLDSIREAEAVTKRELGAMSRTLVASIHGFGDAADLAGETDYINRLLPILTPMHRKLAVNFFRHFSGYNFDDKLGTFTKKNKVKYMDARAEAELLMAEKHPLIEENHPQNIWGWAEHLKLENPKVFNPEKVTKFVKNQIGLATGAGLSKIDVLSAVFEGGFGMDDVVAMLEMVEAGEAAKEAVLKAAGKAPLPEATM